MALHDELLEQARSLAMLDPRRPRQANLRRAISSAYYAVFHLLTHEASSRIVGPTGTAVGSEVNHGIRRWFDHATMKRVANWFLGRDTPPKLNALFRPAAVDGPARVVSVLASRQLRAVADVFVDLQEQRHRADYDHGSPRFTRQRVLLLVEQAEQAFADWEVAQSDPLARLFLLLLLTGESAIPKR